MQRLTPIPSRIRRQRGVVLLFALIALVVLLLAAVALMRSFQSSLFTAGNVGFKRDMQNQSELAVARALASLRSSSQLGSLTARAANNQAYNYSAIQLASNANGIPNALLTDSVFGSVGVASNDITAPDGVTIIRYVLDRLCASAGNEASMGAGGCVLGDTGLPSGVALSEIQNAGSNLGGAHPGVAVTQQSVVYRLSVRVNGPRRTQSFFQSTFTIPS